MKRIDSFDIAKFILSLLVVAIHIKPDGKGTNSFVFPIARIAVPMFFVIGGYLFFKKIHNLDNTHKANALKRYISRLCILYLVWFIILSPYTFWLRKYFSQGVGTGLFLIIQGILIHSTFIASWYLSATIIGTLIVYILARWLNNRKLLIIGLCVYLLCSVLCNYRGLWQNLTLLETVDRIYPGIWNSFPVSIFWIAIGKHYAESPGKTIQHRSWLLIFAIGLLFFENHIGMHFSFIVEYNDCYISLIPVCILLFEYLISWNVQIHNFQFFRNSSTITYCLHATLGQELIHLLRWKGINTSHLPWTLAIYLITVFICLLFAWIITIIEKREKWSWLKTLH